MLAFAFRYFNDLSSYAVAILVPNACSTNSCIILSWNILCYKLEYFTSISYIAAFSFILDIMAEVPCFFILPFSNLRFYIFSLLGRQLEDSGVLSRSLKSRGNSWGLHMPLVCPDGAVVAYAWKRQLAGQAGASAVDRTRYYFQSAYR